MMKDKLNRLSERSNEQFCNKVVSNAPQISE